MKPFDSLPQPQAGVYIPTIVRQDEQQEQLQPLHAELEQCITPLCVPSFTREHVQDMVKPIRDGMILV